MIETNGPVDPAGSLTMSPAMREMSHYPRYLLGRVKAALGKRVLEIGVGHGQYTRELRKQGRAVLATDIDDECVENVAGQFVNDEQVQVGKIDLRDASSIATHHHFRADSILCLNVLEHIENDEAALSWLREVVTDSAGLAVIVPAHQWLYGRMDKEAGHYRRYTRKMLGDVMTQAGWQVEKLRYINVIGAAGWWYHNRFRQDAGLADSAVNSQMRAADKWLPTLGKFTDPLFSRIAGLSVAACGRKRGNG